MVRSLLAALLSLFAVSPAAAAQWRLRAREHYEAGKINYADGQGELGHRGFLSAFDIFREEPMRFSYGLAIQRGGLDRVSHSGGATITSIGAEVKRFPIEKKPLFWRGALLATGIDPFDAGSDFWTFGFTAGVGAEVPVYRIGVAPEIGGRFMRGSAGKRINTLYIALGFHFYVFRGDSAAMPR